jgi:hypothetical protein
MVSETDTRGRSGTSWCVKKPWDKAEAVVLCILPVHVFHFYKLIEEVPVELR